MLFWLLKKLIGWEPKFCEHEWDFEARVYSTPEEFLWFSSPRLIGNKYRCRFCCKGKIV